MPTVMTASHAQVATARGKVGVAHPAAKKTNCGSGKGGFKPGNTCGKGKREALAADLRAARVAARSEAERKTLNQSAKALRDHRRGNDGAIDNDRARVLRSQLKDARGASQSGSGHAGAAKPLDPASHTDHAPGHVGYLNTNLISVDPGRFQFKLGSAAGTGSVGSLAGVRRFDHNLAGITQVWKDPADGKTYIVNGHNRLDLANKLGEKQLTVRFIAANDAAEARSIGAASNIAEGRGTATDAAKYFRDTGQTRAQLEARGIPLREKVAADGLALAKLEDKAFRRVIDGTISPERGAIIGGSDLGHAQQRSLIALIDRKDGKRGEAITNGQLRELIDGVKAAPVRSRTTTDLFGTSVEEESLALHRAKLAAGVKDRLSKEKKLFGLVSRGKNADDLARGGNRIDAHQSGQISQEAGTALAVFDRHKNLAGPVARALNEGSERISNGESPGKVQADVYKRILQAVQETLR